MKMHKTKHPCPDCGIGNITISKRPLVDVLNGHVITVSGAIFCTCDVCDYRDYDEPAKQLLQDLLVLLTTAKPTDATKIISKQAKQPRAQS